MGTMISNASLDASYGRRKQEVKNTIRDIHNNKKEKKKGVGKSIDIGELSISTLACVIQNLRIVVWHWHACIDEGTNLGAELKFRLVELMVLMGTPNIF